MSIGKLKLMVVVSTVFVIVCTFFVLSSIPLEEYNTTPTQTVVPHGVTIKLYEPVLAADVVKVFSKYTYVHVEYNGSITRYAQIKFSANSSSGNVSFNVSESNWTLHYSIFSGNTTSEYMVELNTATGKITGIEHYVNGTIQEPRENMSKDMMLMLHKPFMVSECRDIIDLLALMSVDDTLISMNNYTRIYSRNITVEIGGNKLNGFDVYVSFPRGRENSTVWRQYQYDKWTRIYGSYPVNITFSIVKLPSTNKWIITYMYVELENGIIHEYFLEDIKFA